MQAKTDGSSRINALADDVGVPDNVANLAASIYAQAIDAGFNRVGDGREIPGAVYAAARVEEYPIKPDTLASAFGNTVDGDDVVSDMRRLIDALPYELSIEKPEEYAKRYLERLGYAPGGQLWETTLTLCDDATEDGFAPSGKAPSSFAAAIVYAAAYLIGADVSQDDVADVADVSAVGIRKRYRDVIRASSNHDDEAFGDTSVGDRAAIRITVDRILDAVDGVPDVVREEARSIVDDLPEDDWVERTNPKGVAAGVVYVAAKDNRVSIAQDYVADVAGVSKGTVVSRVKDVRSWRGGVEARKKALDGTKYNRLKELAAENGVDVGAQPERPYLIEQLAKAGVAP